MSDEIVVDALGCVCVCTKEVTNRTADLRCCKKNFNHMRIPLIIFNIMNLFAVGWNIYVTYLFIKLHREPRRAEPLVSFEHQLNPEGYRIYTAGGILSTITAAAAFIIQCVLLHYIRMVVRYGGNTAETVKEFNRYLANSGITTVILTIDLGIAMTDLVLSIGLFLRKFENCETDSSPLEDADIYLQGVLPGKLILWGLISLVMKCIMLAQILRQRLARLDVPRFRTFISFGISNVIMECLSIGIALFAFCFFLSRTEICEMNIRISTSNEFDSWEYTCWSSNQTKQKTAWYNYWKEPCWFFIQSSPMQWPALPGSAEPWVSTVQDSQISSTFTSNDESREIWRGYNWKLEQKSKTDVNSSLGYKHRVIEEVETTFLISAMNFTPIIFIPLIIMLSTLALTLCCNCNNMGRAESSRGQRAWDAYFYHPDYRSSYI